MDEKIKIGLKICWIIVLIYWTFTSFNAKKAKSQENVFTQFIQYWLPLLVAFLLLGPGDWFGNSWLRENFVEHTNTVGYIGLAFAIIGAIIACYARFLLGKNWSLSVQQKNEHELIQSGIYGIVRHPIYLGMLLLFIGNGIIVGDYRAIIAVLIVFISIWFKLKKEEQLLIAIFGEKYRAYQQKTKRIIPFIL